MSDTSSTTACPDAATLRALLDGTLPDDQQTATQTHVDCCPACETALRQMTAGGASWIGMAEKLKVGTEDDPNLAAALDRLKADDGSGDESSEPATDPQRTLDFLQPADDPKLLGKLGRHEISEVIGWGGMGVVLKAYDPSLHRVVAVKVLASHLAHHAVARKRFIREAQAAAAVCHDNVVTIHAIEDGVGSLFQAAFTNSENADGSRRPEKDSRPLHATLPKIIMQFVAGGSLQERIDQEAPLELKEILRIAMQTAAGLAAAHAQGVVHRDVKPANILLENGVQRVKLTDFGLARVMDDASLTLSGVIAGTPQYMAPEQAWGRDVDARADLFSLGAVMYAMCSGHSPFRARTTMAVLKRVCEDPPRPLRAINPDVPEWLVAIIEKLLAKKPEDRFQTATEVSELLGRWLAHVQQPNVVERPQTVSARRGSPDPAAWPDRRSPDWSRGANDGGDLRSNPGAGSGDPRTALPALSAVEQFLLVPRDVTRALYVVVGVALPVLLIILALEVSHSRHWSMADSVWYGGVILAGAVSILCLMIIGGWRGASKVSRGESSNRDLGTGPGAGFGDPRTAHGGWRAARGSAVTLGRGWIPVMIVAVFSGVCVAESWFGLWLNRGSTQLPPQEVLDSVWLSIIYVLLTVCSYGVFYIGWNTPSGSQRAAASGVLAVLAGVLAIAIDHLTPPHHLLFLLQALLSGGYLLAIGCRLLLRNVRDPQELSDRPPEQLGDVASQSFAANTNAGPAVDRQARWRLNFQQTHWPMLITATILVALLGPIVGETGTRDLGSYLGFCLANLALTFALCSAFYSAWNTSSWLVWAGAMLFKLVAGISVLWTTTSRPLAPLLLGGEQALVAFGFLFALMFIRPLFVRGSGNWMSERLSGWQQLFAIACFTVVGTPLVFLLMYVLSYSPRGTPPTARPEPSLDRLLPIDPRGNPDVRPNEFPKPTLLGESNIEPDIPAFPGATAKGAMIPDSLKALLGRWVVVSSEGDQLSSLPAVPKSNAPAGSAGVEAAGIGGAGSFAPGFGGMMGAGATETSPLQWIEFAEDHVLAFDGREGRLRAEFDEDDEPKRFTLRLLAAPSSSGSTGNLDWRYGIFRVEQDRLIVCWTAPGLYQSVPTEFATNVAGKQLLVLRREWNPGPEFHPRETPPPRAVVPFTAREGKLLQEAWAGSADVAVETTNSLGMKLRLIPPGTLDPVGTEALKQIGMRPIGASNAFSQPIYLGTTEVTVAQFRKFVKETRYETTAEQLPSESNPDGRAWRSPGIVQDSDEHPVVHVSWQDAQAFCRWLSDTEQQQYRLPTIAEWAFAMRAGLPSTSTIKPPHNARLRFFDKTAPVGGDTANLFGLHNLFGNVGEWMNDISTTDVVGTDLVWRRYFTVELGGGFQTKFEGGGIQESLRLQVHEQLWDHQADLGFRVARVVTHEVEALSGNWPSLEALIATPTQAGVPARTDTAKPADPKTPTNDTDETPTTLLPVVSLRGLVPTGAFPLAVKFVDFEIERATRPTKNLDLEDVASVVVDSKIPYDAWKKLDLKFSQEILERVGFNEGDWVHELHRDPALTAPSPTFQPPWEKVLVVHPYLPVTPPKSKYEVRYQLFRAFDFEVTPGKSYAYRVRLKFTPAGKHEPPQVIATPWSNPSTWVAVEKPPEAKDR